MSTLAAVQLFALAALVLAVACGALASLAAPVVMRSVASWQPDRRFSALLLLAISPGLLTITSFVSVSLPSGLALVRNGIDHCVSHVGEHAHLCFLHLPHHVGGPASWLLLGFGAAWLTTRAIRGVKALRRAKELSLQLIGSGSSLPGGRALVVPVETPLCMSVGLMRHVVVVSAGLLRQVSDARLEVILRHEEAHARRYDTALRLLASMTTVFMLPSVRARLQFELELAAEQSCDEAAAEAVDRVGVAETILQVERLMGARSVALLPLATSFAGHAAIEERVSALLERPRRGGRTALVVCGLGIALALVLAASSPLHHATETLLGVLTHAH